MEAYLRERSLRRALPARRTLRFVSTYASIPTTMTEASTSQEGLTAITFTTLIPATPNDGTSVKPTVLSRLIDRLWRPFGGMTEEGQVTGHWIDDDGTEFTDVCIKLSIECDRDRLQEAMRTV